MKKLKLDLGALEIESFRTAADPLMQQSMSADGTCYQNTCAQDCTWTAYETCGACPITREVSCFVC